MRNFLFEKDSWDFNALSEFEQFVEEIMDDPDATLDEYYPSFSKFCRRIERFGAQSGGEGIKIDSSRTALKNAMKRITQQCGDVETNKLLALAMLMMVKTQLSSQMTEKSLREDFHPVRRFQQWRTRRREDREAKKILMAKLNSLMDHLIDDVKNGKLLANDDDEKMTNESLTEVNRFLESSYFGDSELDNADAPTGILHQREEMPNRRKHMTDDEYDDWEDRRYREKRLYNSKQRAIKIFTEFDESEDLFPTILADFDDPVEGRYRPFDYDTTDEEKICDLFYLKGNFENNPFAYIEPRVMFLTDRLAHCSKELKYAISDANTKNYKKLSNTLKNFLDNANPEDVYVFDENNKPVEYTKKYFKLLRQSIVDSARGFARDVREILKRTK